MRNAQKKRITILLLCLTLLLTGCVKDNFAVRDCLKRFESCCQKADLDGMLDCVDPNRFTLLRAGLGFLSELTGKSDTEMFQFVLGLILDKDGDSFELTKNFQIEIKHIQLSDRGDRAYVDCILILEPGDDRLEFSAEFTMSKREETWYVYSLRVH